MKGNQSYLLIIEPENIDNSLSNILMLDGFTRPIKSYNNTSEALEYLDISNNNYGWNINLPDLIMIDYDSGSKPILEFVQRVKSSNNLKIIPLILLSKQFEDKELEAFYQLGTNSCFIKPQDESSLKQLCNVIHQYWMHTILF